MNRLSIILIISLTIFAACDGGGGGPKGKITVNVTLDSDLAGYPTDTHTLASIDTHLWEYPLVGGEGLEDDPESTLGDGGTSRLTQDNESNEDIDEPGNKHVYVYIYGNLGVKSSSTAVLYKGESSASGTTHTITVNVEPGETGALIEYYVVAFYNYSGGDNITNRLNRYDRYVIYNDISPDPYVDNATAVTVTEESPLTIDLSIETNWVLGKPKWENLGSQGRLFLTESDTIPTP